MEIKVDKNLCIGCGLCTTIAPDSFRLGDDGKSEVTDSSEGSEESIQEAIDSCPVQAICKGSDQEDQAT